MASKAMHVEPTKGVFEMEHLARVPGDGQRSVVKPDGA